MSQAAYGLFNANVLFELPSRDWSFQIWGKNLADKKYVIVTSASGVTPNGLSGEPQTFGVRLSKTW